MKKKLKRKASGIKRPPSAQDKIADKDIVSPESKYLNKQNICADSPDWLSKNMNGYDDWVLGS
jgi:hypothetical protein